MPNVNGKYLIVPKHKHGNKSKGKGKRLQRRQFHDEQELETMRRLAGQYAAEHGEDFLIVQVVEEIEKPSVAGMPVKLDQTMATDEIKIVRPKKYTCNFCQFGGNLSIEELIKHLKDDHGLIEPSQL